MPSPNQIRPQQLLVILALAAVVASPCWADSCVALSDFRDGNFAAAVLAISNAKNTDADTCHVQLIEEMFARYRGRRPYQHPPEALVSALIPLVDAGPPEAQYAVYDLARDGPDSEAAWQLLVKAASAGNAEAQYDYYFRIEGAILIGDRMASRKANAHARERIQWLEKAAEGGALRAMDLLAIYYDAPPSNPEDWMPRTKFARLLKPRARPGRDDERMLFQVDVGKAFELRRRIATSVPRQGFAEDKELIAEAQRALARAYFRGVGVSADVDAGIRWETSAAEAGTRVTSLLAAIHLSAIYAQSFYGVPKDMQLAQQWCDVAKRLAPWNDAPGINHCPFKP